MKQLMKMLWAALLVLVAGTAAAQYPEPQRGFSQAELDQMLAPIALYPDSLLSQILTASTYPQDVAEAASWSRANSSVRGESAVRLVENEPWDPSVIGLVAFPQVLAMMDERRDWTHRLGEAFIAQPNQVMDTVQELRARADAMGTLTSGEEMVVQRQGTDYVIESPTPEVMYVPYYDPRVVYGTWWWPAYQPIYWNPWPGYAWRHGYRGLGWGYSIALGSGFHLSYFDWPRRYVRYSSYRPWYHHGRDYRAGVRWSVNHTHRERGAERYRTGGGSRDGTRDGRNSRDGRRDANRDVNRGDVNRGDGRNDRRPTPQQTAAPAPTTQQGFFPQQEAARTPGAQRDRNASRPTLPTYREDGGQRTDNGTRQRAVPQDRAAPQERVAREQPSGAVPLSRVQPSQPQRTAPAQPAPQPVAAQAAPRAVPAPPPQREQAPAARPERVEVQRDDSSSGQASGPPQRSGGRGMSR